MRRTIESADELGALVNEWGFLPLFRSSVPGFSLEEMTPRERWFVSGVEGPWEWREKIAASEDFAYGKLFGRKAGFIGREWLGDFINYRRDGYDYDARYEDSLSSIKCKRIVDALEKHGLMLMGDLRRASGFGKDGDKGFDGALTLLQMQTYVTIESFYYKQDAFGQSYGFGIGRYCLMERKFGAEFVSKAYDRSPRASLDRIVSRLVALRPEISADEAEGFLRG